MKSILIGVAGVCLVAGVASASIITFGSGGNAFDMDFVDVGNAGNAADDTGYGAVGYNYKMGTHEVSRDMITKYNAQAGVAISLQDMTSYGGNRANMAATGISWNEAARFVNWLNISSGGVAAYNFTGLGVNDFALWESGDAGYDASNEYRNSLAKYVLPSEDEWYKAAYYNGSGGYDDYATQTGDTAPTAVANGTTAGTAVYDQIFGQGPADITNAGGLSAYGTMAQNGNVWEWGESAIDGSNDSAVDSRVLRGGYWYNTSSNLRSSFRPGYDPTGEGFGIGFRVAVVTPVPEPSGVLLTGIGALGLLIRRHRKG
ncbi:MAG: SUMF1/EgtB/PvdO family nonheme iron enzyme [Akkermansiaceae bacterium]